LAGWQEKMRWLVVHSLRAKLLLFALLLGVVPGIAFTFMAIPRARQALETAVGRQLAEVAHDAAVEITDLLAREQRDVQTWARQDLMREIVIGDLDKRITRVLVSLKANDTAYTDMLCIDAAGRVVAASNPALLGAQQADRDWARAALSGQAFVAGPTPSAAHGRPVIEIASPVYHPEREGMVIGALLGLYDWERVAALAARVQRNSRKLKLAVDIIILDDGGEVIAEAPPLHGPGLAGQNLRAAGWRTARRAHRDGKPGYLREAVAGALVGHAAVETPHLGWAVLVTQPLHEALAEVDELQRRLMLLLIGILLCALGVALLLANRMSRPLRELTAATKEIGRAGETRQPVPVRSRDEIGQLAQAFNAMAGHLKQAQDDLVVAAKFAFVGEVAAGVAHEVRTPLGILRSSAQILGRSLPVDRPETAELVEMLITEVDRLDRVVDGLLELARPREPLVEPTPLTPVLARALDFVEGQAREQGIVIRRALAADQPPAWCDPEQIYQVALNLIVNALQILPRGGELTVRTVPDHNGRLGFEVSDNGPGMPPEVREHIFTPFFTLRKGGTGLGLALVQRVVQAHQGTVSVDSTVGHGTTFRVELPAAEGDG
jgi:signal transduction histidine kinase